MTPHLYTLSHLTLFVAIYFPPPHPQVQSITNGHLCIQVTYIQGITNMQYCTDNCCILNLQMLIFSLLTVRKEKLKHERWALLSSPHSCHRNACAAFHHPLHSKCYWCIAPNQVPRLRLHPEEATSPPSLLYCLLCCLVLAFLIRDFPCWKKFHKLLICNQSNKSRGSS